MEKRRIWIFLAVAGIAAVVLLGMFAKEWGGEKTPDGQTRESARREADAEGERAKEKEKSAAQLRVEREGKLLEGWEEAPCIVIDAGHGGFDPGKMGVNQVPEKEVNLAIAGLVREYLEAAGVRVVMTRTEDIELCGEGQDNKKVRDLKRRIAIIEEAAPIAAVSIHQNSYPEEAIHGAQVFYYVTSGEGKCLAENLQKRLISEADPENDRQVKANGSYYLLKKTQVPLVIVECGFLSNREEAQRLCVPEYQETLAWAVYLGIMDYLERKQM